MTLNHSSHVPCCCRQYAPYKAGSKRTKAEAARQLGLEPAALALLEGSDYVNLQALLRPDTPGLHTLADIEDNICYIIADVLSKDKDVLDELRALWVCVEWVKVGDYLIRIFFEWGIVKYVSLTKKM